MRKHRSPGGVKVARFPGMSEVSSSTLFSIDLCCIYLVFTMLFIFVKRMYSQAWCLVGVHVPYSFLTLIGHPRQHYNLDHTILFTCVYL